MCLFSFIVSLAIVVVVSAVLSLLVLAFVANRFNPR